jgi:hypothetical protein
VRDWIFPSTVAERKGGNAIRSDQSTLRADHRNRIMIYGPKADGTYWVSLGLRMAECIAQCLNLAECPIWVT